MAHRRNGRSEAASVDSVCKTRLKCINKNCIASIHVVAMLRNHKPIRRKNTKAHSRAVAAFNGGHFGRVDPLNPSLEFGMSETVAPIPHGGGNNGGSITTIIHRRLQQPNGSNTIITTSTPTLPTLTEQSSVTTAATSTNNTEQQQQQHQQQVFVPRLLSAQHIAERRLKILKLQQKYWQTKQTGAQQLMTLPSSPPNPHSLVQPNSNTPLRRTIINNPSLLPQSTTTTSHIAPQTRAPTTVISSKQIKPNYPRLFSDSAVPSLMYDSSTMTLGGSRARAMPNPLGGINPL
jgi:hypothetical protein